MLKFMRTPVITLLMAAIIAGCASKRTPPEILPPSPAQNAGYTDAYVAPQSAPVRPPTYPALGGPVFGTGYIQLIQGR